MKPWKAALGLASACAACCALPLWGLASGLTAFGSVLAACAGELLPGALVVAVAMVTAWWWQRRRAAPRAQACVCATACSAFNSDC
jgi:TRAP-type C4-dicarboxylate transport system permease large subunit